LRALEGSAEVTVVAVAEPLEASAAQLREQGLAVYPTVEEMLDGSELDGVLIADWRAISNVHQRLVDRETADSPQSRGVFRSGPAVVSRSRTSLTRILRRQSAGDKGHPLGARHTVLAPTISALP
jgi:hypothetical protein